MRTTVIAVAVLSLASFTATPAFAQNENDSQGTARLVKDCPYYDFTPWSFCTIGSSNIPEIPRGSKVYYTQTTNIVPGIIDSNVLLDAGNGNLATGRRTFYFPNPSTANGLCQYTDGIGQLAGFQARLVVTPIEGTSYNLIGPYQFKDANNQQTQSN